jgi:hypothetical protein
VLGFSAARAVGHRRQRRRDAGICFRAGEDQPGEFAAYGLRPGRARAGVTQYLVASATNHDARSALATQPPARESG